MIPRLFVGTATDFSVIGTALADCISCVVQEERNGVYELTAVVSTTTPYFNTIKVGMLIVAKPNHTQTPQAFEIYEISSPINQQVTIRANHISYRQTFIPVSPFSCTGITATLNGLGTNALETNPFTFTTDITNETSTYNQIEPASMRSRLGGTRGSVLDVFGGEYEWDNWTTRLWLHRGADNGVQLRLGKNITNLEQTQNYERVVTGVLPYWHNSDDTLQYYGDIQYSSAVSDYPSPRTIVLDLSSDFENAPTLSQLNTAGANYLAQESLATPNNSISVAFVDLADTTEYADSPLERVNLCDTVEVIYPALNIDYKAKAIRVLFDVLAERTLEVEIGDARSTIASTITDIVGDVDSAVKTGNRLISVTQNINREIGEITQTIGEVREEALDSVTEAEQRLSNDISSTAEQTKQTITAETQTKLNALEGQITTDYEKYTNERVDSAQSTIQTWTSERYDTNIENLQDDVGDLQGDVSSAQSSINTMQVSITALQTAIASLQNGIGKAFVVDSTGTKVYAVENNQIIQGTYTLTDEDGNHYFVSNTETSWATATEFGCVQLSIGKDVNDTARWRTVMNENTLDDIYHA